MMSDTTRKKNIAIREADSEVGYDYVLCMTERSPQCKSAILDIHIGMLSFVLPLARSLALFVSIAGSSGDLCVE